jgi:ADP-heptose:LPS heptosyltransferase
MKILVVRFSSIGDIVLTTPVVRCLAEQLPDAEIHYLTKQGFVSILEGNPHIRKVITIRSSVKEQLEDLKREQYDVVIDLHHNVRTLRLKRALGRKSYAFPKKNIAKWLLTTFKWNTMPDVHVVDRYFEAVKPLGVHSDLKSCELFLRDSDRVDFTSVGIPEGPFVAVAMGTQFATKQMPVSLMTEILRDLPLPIVLLGGPGDVERSQELSAILKAQQTIDLCGKLSLLQSADVLRRARALLTGDTGLMHMATAFEIPVVSVWGNTVPALGMYPYMPSHPEGFTIHEVQGLPCRPCSKIGHKSCPKKHFNCMAQQDSASIRKALTDYLA